MALPDHVAIIMDGNGRWARARGLERIEGHRRGAEVVRDITTFNRELNIPYLTLYSFSVQNWQRPGPEVVGLMELLREFCANEERTLMDNGIRLHSIGRQDRLPASTRRALDGLMDTTANNRAMTLTLAVDYGGREELLDAARRLAASGRAPEEIDDQAMGEALSTHGLPDPDLIVRTSGEQRISNFLLWQAAYAELYFTHTLWPDFTRDDYRQALDTYSGRQRRFGLTEGQLAGKERQAC